MSSKLRDALNQLLGLIDNEILVFSDPLEPSDISQAQYHIDKAGEALAEPLRNCDVGTAEEQIKRFFDEYYAENSKCTHRWSFGGCAIYWVQMPYEEVK